MKYWIITVRNFYGLSKQERSAHLKSLMDEHYDAAVFFCYFEWDFTAIPNYQEIINILASKNMKMYIITGTNHTGSVPDNIEIINWHTSFFRDTLTLVDTAIYKEQLNYKHYFLYLNQTCRTHRCVLMDIVAKFDLLKHSEYSWINNKFINNSYKFKYFKGSRKYLDTMEIYLNVPIPKQSYESFFHLVSETTDKAQFITEKTIIPLLIGKPFIVAGASGIHQTLKNLGFKLYDELFDYAFDDIEDTEQRYTAICENIKNITNLSFDQCRELNIKILDKIRFNRNRAIEIAYDENLMPQLVKDIIKNYYQTGEKIEEFIINTELILCDIKEKLQKNKF